MKLTPKQLDALEQLADTHFALHQRLNEIVFLEGAKLFEPIKDMTLDDGDVAKIERQLFKSLEKYPEFKAYVKARKSTLADMASLHTKMKKAQTKDWKELIETELNLHLAKGLRLMASKIGVSYGGKEYMQ